jgi:hypothetical protein
LSIIDACACKYVVAYRPTVSPVPFKPEDMIAVKEGLRLSVVDVLPSLCLGKGTEVCTDIFRFRTEAVEEPVSVNGELVDDSESAGKSAMVVACKKEEILII